MTKWAQKNREGKFALPVYDLATVNWPLFDSFNRFPRRPRNLPSHGWRSSALHTAGTGG